MNHKLLYLLASYPKSGNTWCRAFLTNYLKDEETPVSINSLQNDEKLTMVSDRGFIDNLLGIESSILTEKEANELKKEGLLKFNNSLKSQVYLKIHDAFPRKDEPDWFPSEAIGGVIYVVRNPLDIAKSLSNHLDASIDTAIGNLNSSDYELCKNRKQFFAQLPQVLHSWSEHVESWIEGYQGNICLIRYEDMLKKPMESFGKIIQFIGYEYDENRLKKAIQNSDFKVLKANEEKDGFVEKPLKAKSFFREGKSGTWRKYLSEKNIQDILKGHSKVMKRLGYLDENDNILV